MSQSRKDEPIDTQTLTRWRRYVFDSFQKESDAVVVIVGVAYLDGALQRLLTACLVDDPKLVAELFRYDGGLGSFGARVKLAYLLGLVSDEERNDLDLLRRVRNDFAHNPEATLSTHADRCSCLRLCQRVLPHLKLDTPRERVMFTITLLGTLQARTSTVTRNRCAPHAPTEVTRLKWPPEEYPDDS